MFRAFHQRMGRGAISLIVAYALVLQAFFSYSLVTQAAAQDDASQSALFFVICNSHDTAAAPNGADVPAKPAAHCPICTLSAAGAAALPDPIMLPVRQAVAGSASFVSAAACISFLQARAGLSRAPPQNA
jgi:hypothetical protein